jgi:hypothetical protein
MLQTQKKKRGVARYAGSQRRIVNQHRTGVVSRFTKRDILKGRSEHVWTEEFDVCTMIII